ncbi:MAG TPA: arabinogalactan endo-1,4-beta-galactosidase [Polyangiaceae bacterium]
MSRKKLLSALALIQMAGLVASNAAWAAEVPQLINAGFELDGSGAASPEGWQSVGSLDADFTEWGGYSGNWRLSHYSAGPFSIDTQQTLQGLRRGWYSLRAKVRRSSDANNAYIELRCGGDPQRAYLPVAWPNQWLQIVVSAQVKHGTCTIVLHSDGQGGQWSNFDDIELVAGEARLSVLGADVSSLVKSEDLGGLYFDARDHECRGRSDDRSALGILEHHGLDFIRLRVWVNPADGYHDEAELREMAWRAHIHGLKTLVDIQYSDTWADPGHQSKPAAWANYTIEQLTQAVYDHTYAMCKAAQVFGRGPAMIQLGNELNSGMLWPDGHTWDPPNWDNLASFLKAGHAAVKACSPSTKVVLHLANGGDNGAFRWWFDNITARGVEFDVIAASYYGYWHGSLGDLQWNLNDMAARYGKDVLVAETAYPFTLDDADGWSNLIGQSSQLVAGYSATPAGQAANFRDVMSIVRAVPNGRGLGVFYWDGTWISVRGNGWDPTHANSGNAWENQALFDFNGRVLPAADELKP